MTVFAADADTSGQDPIVTDEASIEEVEPTPDGEVLPSQTPIASTEPTESVEATASAEPSASEEPSASTEVLLMGMQAMDFETMATFTGVNSDAAFNTALSSATGTALEPDVIEISGDFNITSAKTIAAGKYIKVISTEGSTFTLRRGLSTINMFDVQGSLILENIIIDGGSSNTAKNTVNVSSGASFAMETGAVLQNAWCTSAKGSAVYNQGNFVLNGGRIINNQIIWADYVSGGVVYNTGTFTMTAGNITGNKSDTNEFARLRCEWRRGL